jgi:mannitol/fructose-specific phosphotransferase system IIA component (Ntr-type)
MAVGLQPAGIDDYESMDGETVKIVVLIVAPQGEHELYIRLLAAVVERLKDADIRERLLACGEADAIYDVLTGEGA